MKPLEFRNELDYSAFVDAFTGLPRHKYETVNIMTLAGLEHAEALKEDGWEVVQVGFCTVTMMKRLESE